MNASMVVAALPRGHAWLRRFGIAFSTGVVLGAYAVLDAGWRDSLKAALVFVLGAYPLCRLLQGRALRISYSIWATLFALDVGIKAFLIEVYQTEPDAVLVIDAISNTTSDESVEFVQQYAPLLMQYVLAAAVVLALLLWLRPNAVPMLRQKARWAVVVLVLFLGLHANPTFRRSNPAVFWPTQLLHYQHFQDKLAQLDDKRRIAEQKLPQWAPVYVGPQQHTVAVVLGESTNRWNWQLYGYPRATTPQLMREARDALVFRDVISGASGTVASFRLMLTPAELDNRLDDEAEPSVVLLAKAAGYKTFWISNQQDRFINPRFAAEADVVHLVNVGGGRGDRKLDEGVLPFWDEALRDPAPRKMIFVHLLGAHPHYEMRSPPNFHRFSGSDDAVIEQMRKDGRSPWVRLQRNSYDNAMLYQDTVIARLLHSFKADVGAQSGAFLFTSDHAQEVGHTRDFAGHSLSEAGMTVPFFVWMSPRPDAATAVALERRPFQTDVLDWALLDLARIQTRLDRPQLDLFSPRFIAQTRLIGDKPYTPSQRRHD
ncbi:phosphoethanolamine transferase [Solimonas soli]|uniref:phosphoethanolamine transferase n=1 Tax=Solimonas soli TaxID=413479 RepID=UPI0006861029|nr:phosphoethanolamine transferase [Solimonas soli]